MTTEPATPSATTQAVLDQLDARYGHSPYYVLGKIEAEARDDISGTLATPKRRLARIVELIDAWERADQQHRDPQHRDQQP